MTATLWSDYLCPWCYLGRTQTKLLEDLGVVVDRRAYELHPDVAPEGTEVRPGGKLAGVFDRVGALCAEAGVDFQAPTRIPNTRLALSVAEVVRRDAPDRLGRLDPMIWDALWLQDRDISSDAVLGDLIAAVGLAPDGVLAAAGAEPGLVDDAKAEAQELGIYAVPSWLLGPTLVVPGVQDPAQITRWVGKLRSQGN